jgi:hypothetical protein
MRYHRHIQAGLTAGTLILALGACNRQKSTVPELQTTTGVQSKSEPMTVEGCLKSGMADQTLVLAASKTEGAFQTATFQLMGPERLNLRDYIGQRVEVSGTLVAEEQVTSIGDTAEQKPATGTAGTPTVGTTSHVAIKRLNVDSVKPSGQRCD